MRPVISHDIPGLDSIDLVLEKLDEVLSDLIGISEDIEGPEDTAMLKANIKFMKGYYERAERLLLDQNKGNTNVPTQAEPEIKSETRVAQITRESLAATMPKQRKKISWGPAENAPK